MKYFYMLLFCLIFLSSCESNKTVYFDFEDFVELNSRLAGGGASNCGVTDNLEDLLELNVCVSTAFLNRESNFAVYRDIGMGSDIATSVAITSDSRVFLLVYEGGVLFFEDQEDLFIGGGECFEPSFTGIVDALFTDLFTCTESQQS